MTYAGSSLCGDVNFEVHGEFESLCLCHCKHCQKDTGSAHASNLFSTTAKLIWRTGENKVKTYQLPSTRHVKCFCSTCGSAVPCIQMSNKLVVVPAGSLNQDITIKPTAHIYQSSAAAWAKNLDKVKSYEQLPK
jgi:hypothetical protein